MNGLEITAKSNQIIQLFANDGVSPEDALVILELVKTTIYKFVEVKV